MALKGAAGVLYALHRAEHSWLRQACLQTVAPALQWAARSAQQTSAARGFCDVPPPPTPAPSTSGAFRVPPVSPDLDEAACFGSAFRQKSAEFSVNVKSFLLGSQLDLAKLKPSFRDVLRAEGKDYLVVGFRPSQNKEVFHGIAEGSSLEEATPDIPSMRVSPEPPSPQGLSALAPDDTYFVVFRYGAVVLFQGRRRLPELDTCKHVVAPKHGPYPRGPWETDMQVWEQASGKDKEDADRHLIYLLLRPFMSNTSSSLPADIFSMKAPNQRDLQADSHTEIDMGLSTARPLLYNESVRLFVRPDQQDFVVQKSDTFYVKQFDVGVLRCVASALGQSCAIDFYSSKANTALQWAQEANMQMAMEGSIKRHGQKSTDFSKMIGYCAFIHGALISQLGLLDKNDLAWQYAHYDKMVDIMRAEFELDKRTQHLREKIAAIARDAGTFVSMQQHDNSAFLEWLIILLISAECVLSIVDLSLRWFE